MRLGIERHPHQHLPHSKSESFVLLGQKQYLDRHCHSLHSKADKNAFQMREVGDFETKKEHMLVRKKCQKSSLGNY